MNTLPSRLYSVLFPIEDIRQTIKTAKIILTKVKIDRQLLSQLTSTPFMNIKDISGCNKKTVLFNNHNVLDTKINKLNQ